MLWAVPHWTAPLMLSVTWHAVPGNESDNVFGGYFEGKVALVKSISLLMLPNCFQRLAAEGHPAFNYFQPESYSPCTVSLRCPCEEPGYIVCTIVLLFLSSSFPKPYHHALSLGPSTLFFYVDQFQPKVSIQNTKWDSLNGVPFQQQQFIHPAPARGPSRFCPHSKGHRPMLLTRYQMYSSFQALAVLAWSAADFQRSDSGKGWAISLQSSSSSLPLWSSLLSSKNLG